MVLWVKQILGHFFFLEQNMKCKNILIKKSFFVEIDIIIFRWKISAIRRCSVSYIHVCLFVFVLFFRYAWENSRHLDTPPLVSLWNGNSSVCHAGNLLQPIRCTTQIWVIDTSSVWNFYSHSSYQCHFTGKSVMDCHERSWRCSHATFLSPLVVRCTLHTHSCADLIKCDYVVQRF